MEIRSKARFRRRAAADRGAVPAAATARRGRGRAISRGERDHGGACPRNARELLGEGVRASRAVAGPRLVLDVERRDRPGTLAAGLDFVPESKALRASLHLDEAAGGILAEIADLPDRPPVTLAFDGDGTLDAFRSKLAFHGRAAIGADGTFVLDRDGTARMLALDLAARLPSLSFERMTAKLAAVREMDQRAPACSTCAPRRTGKGDLGDTALAEAIGKEVRLTMRGSGKMTGPVDVANVARSPRRPCRPSSRGFSAPTLLKGHLDAEAARPVAVRAARGHRLTGRYEAHGRCRRRADGRAASRRRSTQSRRRFATGIAPIDGLTGGEARLAGGVSYQPGRRLPSRQSDLTGLYASARIDGTASPQSADVTATLLTIPSLEKADKRSVGTRRSDGACQRHPRASRCDTDSSDQRWRHCSGAPCRASSWRRAGPISSAHSTPRRVSTEPSAARSREGSLHAARSASGETRLDPLDLTIGSVVVSGAGTLDPAYSRDGKARGPCARSRRSLAFGAREALGQLSMPT